jgi:hypothetical protein
MVRRRALALAIPLALAPAWFACAGAAPPVPAPAGQEVPAAPGNAAGTVAYVDTGGCIAWVPVEGGPAGRACPPTRGGITAITWLDAATIAYVTPELSRTGWRAIRTTTGEDIALDPLESPRIYQVGAPQFYSVLGERIDIENGAAAWTSADGTGRRILLAPGEGRDRLAMVTWSPDGRGVLLAEGAHKALWVAFPHGSEPRRIAPASTGIASWFVPSAGAMPHADLTCTLPTEFTYRCQSEPWKPSEAAEVPAGATVLLAYSACPGVTGYELEVTGPGGAVLLRRVSAAQVQRFTPPAPGTYQWRVRTLIGAEPTAWSPPRTLTATN